MLEKPEKTNDASSAIQGVETAPAQTPYWYESLQPPSLIMGDVLNRFQETRIVPVIVIDDASAAAPLATALADGGLACAEITFRTAAAEEALRRMVHDRPDMLVGAGTVLTPRQAAAAQRAGARFIVSPGFNPRVVDYCREHAMPVFPGVCTPSEIEAALERDLHVLKFFPAEPMGGVAFLRAIAAPYGQVKFLPTGGIDLATLAAYLKLPCVAACGGSWMAPAGWIRESRFERIRQETQRTMQAVRALTGA